MDKHTRRYMYDIGLDEHAEAQDLADVIKQGGYEEGYLSDAVDLLDNNMDRHVLKEAMARRRLGL